MIASTVAVLLCGADAATVAAQNTTTKKAATKTTAKKSAVRKSSSTKTVAARAPAPRRQLVPSPDRYREIQQALAAKGYLQPEEANGQWTDNSAAALKRFQTDQNLDATGKINSLSLIALGLGPKHETVASPAQTPPAPTKGTQ